MIERIEKRLPFTVSGWLAFKDQADLYLRSQMADPVSVETSVSITDNRPRLVHRVDTPESSTLVDFTPVVTPAGEMLIIAGYDPTKPAAGAHLDGLTKFFQAGRPGQRAGTHERVEEFDRLLRTGECTSYRQAQARVKTLFGTGIDVRTYKDNCKAVTGKEPIYLPKE